MAESLLEPCKPPATPPSSADRRGVLLSMVALVFSIPALIGA